MRGEAGLGEVVEDYLSRPLRFNVYNHEYGVVREVTVTPSRNWGGEGALGCTLGYGALHRIPPPLEEPPAGPGDMLFETARFSNEEPRSGSPSRYAPQNQSLLDTTNAQNGSSNPYNLTSPSLLVPAAIDNPPPLISKTSPPPASGNVRTPRKARPVSPNKGLAFDEYWKESEKKSREVDFAPSTSSKSVPAPPPPKANGMSVSTRLPIPPPSGGEPRQTRCPDPANLFDDEDDEDGQNEGDKEKEEDKQQGEDQVQLGEGDQDWMKAT